jgi:hypothetical protein
VKAPVSAKKFLESHLPSDSYSSARVPSTRPLKLVLLFFFPILMKLSRFFILPPMLDWMVLSLFVLFALLPVCGRPSMLWPRLCANARLCWLIEFGKLGKASGVGDVELRKLKLRRFLPVSLLRLREDAVVETSSGWSSAVYLRGLLSFSFSFSFSFSGFTASSTAAGLLKNPRLKRFLSWREGRGSGIGEFTLVPPLTCGVWLDGLVLREGEVAATSHDPVGERVGGGGIVGTR